MRRCETQSIGFERPCQGHRWLHQRPSPINGIDESSAAVWESWFAKVFSLSYARNIKAITFISQDWGQYPSNGVQWADARLQNNELVSRAFFAETSKARYLKQSPTLFEELGYTP
ncbi:MAG: hypothetical protein AAF627_17260 [Myxococcota bacterium]